MEQPVWSFTRGTDQLQISRESLDDGVLLIVAGDGAPRSYFFRDLNRLEVFQRDMETLLLKTGWSFTEFTPEQRLGADRRSWPRRANDRRRWWTDGARQPRQPALKDDPILGLQRKGTAERPLGEATPNGKGTRTP